QSLEAGNSKGGQSTVLMLLRDSLDPKLTGQIRQIVRLGRNSRGVEIVQPCACDVDGVGIEYVCPGQRALLAQRRLIAFLKAAAVGHSAKDCGDQLRIVNQAEPEKSLILRTEVHVETSIKGLAVLFEVRRDNVVRRSP